MNGGDVHQRARNVVGLVGKLVQESMVPARSTKWVWPPDNNIMIHEPQRYGLSKYMSHSEA